MSRHHDAVPTRAVWARESARIAGALREPARLAELTEAQLPDFLAVAAYHRLLPWLQYRAERQRLAMPPAVAAGLRAAVVRETARALARQASLRRLLRLLDAPRVPVLLLKGAHLALVHYPEARLRPMGDLDLLLSESQLPAAWTRLLGAGWRPESEHEAVLFGAAATRHQLPTLVGPDGVRVELHRSAFVLDHPAARSMLPGVFARARPLPGDPSALGMAAEDLLLHLVEHAGSHHGWSVGLNVLVDMQRVLAVTPPDWAVLVGRARDWGLAGHLAIAGALLAELDGTALPVGKLLSAAERDWAQCQLPMVRRQLFEGWTFLSRRSRVLATAGLLLDRPRDAVRVLRARLWPTSPGAGSVPRPARGDSVRDLASAGRRIGLLLTALADGRQRRELWDELRRRRQRRGWRV